MNITHAKEQRTESVTNELTTDVVPEELTDEQRTELQKESDKLELAELEKDYIEKIATDDIATIKAQLSTSGWVVGLVEELTKLKRLSKGKTVFYMDYSKFCEKFNGGIMFANTGNSVRTRISSKYELTSEEAKDIVPYNNNKKAKGQKNATGKLLIDYMKLKL